MKIFVTGATGFIGSAVVPLLVKDGHQVRGLTRSDEGAKALVAAGAEAYHGDLENIETIRKGAEGVDGVIHLGFVHDWSRFNEVTEIDRRVITAIGDVLGTGKPFLVTSGAGLGIKKPGELATEDFFDANHPHPRKASEDAANALLERGLNVGLVRLPQVHDTRKQGLITPLLEIFREKGVAAYVGEGQNRYAAGALADVALLYTLALYRAEKGARYHAVGEEGVTTREIAEALGRGLKMPVKSVQPEEASEYFGWMAMFAGVDMPASSAITQKKLGWKPTGPGLIEDLDGMTY